MMESERKYRHKIVTIISFIIINLLFFMPGSLVSWIYFDSSYRIFDLSHARLLDLSWDHIYRRKGYVFWLCILLDAPIFNIYFGVVLMNLLSREVKSRVTFILFFLISFLFFLHSYNYITARYISFFQPGPLRAEGFCIVKILEVTMILYFFLKSIWPEKKFFIERWLRI